MKKLKMLKLAVLGVVVGGVAAVAVAEDISGRAAGFQMEIHNLGQMVGIEESYANGNAPPPSGSSKLTVGVNRFVDFNVKPNQQIDAIIKYNFYGVSNHNFIGFCTIFYGGMMPPQTIISCSNNKIVISSVEDIANGAKITINYVSPTNSSLKANHKLAIK